MRKNMLVVIFTGTQLLLPRASFASNSLSTSGSVDARPIESSVLEDSQTQLALVAKRAAPAPAFESLIELGKNPVKSEQTLSVLVDVMSSGGMLWLSPRYKPVREQAAMILKSNGKMLNRNLQESIAYVAASDRMEVKLLALDILASLDSVDAQSVAPLYGLRTHVSFFARTEDLVRIEGLLTNIFAKATSTDGSNSESAFDVPGSDIEPAASTGSGSSSPSLISLGTGMSCESLGTPSP